MVRTMSSHDELLEGYLAHAEAVAHERKDTSFWAFNELADLMRDDPDGAWQIIVDLVGLASDEETLARGRMPAFARPSHACGDGHGCRRKYVRGWTCSWPKSAAGECRRTGAVEVHR